jgi:AbrB family looped-hinge helix DNA binding protein
MATTVTIDDAGRFVIPRAIRQRLHLHAGSRLRLTERADQIVLEVEPSEVELKEEGGILVAVGALEGDVPDHRDLRSERLGQLSSLSRSRR